MKNALDKMLSNLYKGLWAVDANNKFIYFSKGMEDITGISEERIIGKDIKDFMEVAQLCVGDETHFTELSLQAKDKLKPTRYHSLSFLTPEGNLNLLSGHIIPMLNGSDKYTGLICTVESVSEQKIREKTFKDMITSKKELEEIYKNSPVVAFLWTAEKDWPVEFVSDNITQFGYTPEDFTSGNMIYGDIVHPDDLDFVRNDITRLEIEGRQFFSKEYRILTRAEEPRWVAERSLMVPDEDGRPSYYQGIIIDVTDRKLAEQALLETEKRFRLIFENSPLGIFTFDKDGIITHCNTNFAMIMGASMDKIIGLNILRSIKDKKMTDAVKPVFARKTGHYEGKCVSALSGKVTPIKADYSPNIAEDGSILGGIGIIEDITTRIESEEALKKYAEELAIANEELKSLDQMKDRFLSNVSHELKTPLTSIKGYTELIYDESLGTLSEQQKEVEKTVLRNANRLKRLVDSLLYISRAQSGNVQYLFEPVSIVEIVEMTLQDLKIQIEEKKLAVEKDIPNDIPTINGDRDKLTDMLTNMVDNSIKFTPEGGSLKFTIKEEDEFIHIVLKDNGIGIPPDMIPMLFQRFYQIDASRTRKYGGTGLGLYICKEIVTAHKGKIWVESKGENKGTEMHIQLPK
ncbi:PAS domain S-box protein [Methanococcoides burtonii]|uniref:histidine kinase n=1 Tax=Methanococcoides burtonii (strain DSM 6242 / NBRC 107633 / OCM 468 / ACE-M) TaxID=259564 RepID=Q12X67_METBU|nr:PAS domain S-box protein [Methanococcoides burtonii]ABE51959.1 HATPase domain-containing multisensor signal transduction histidine kinase [Methanococcoides burtonii DSM 6242]